MDDRTQVMSARPLPNGHELLWYSLEGVLGQGGFGITYLGNDNNLNRKVAIKEYLPSVFAFRNSDFTVNPMTGDHAENYTWGLNSFLSEAQTLARFRHRNVVQVLAVFEENNTAYMVMEYEHGESLSHVFKTRPQQLDQQFYEGILFPVMDGLQNIHDAGFIHRDIKPANLYLREDGSPVLIDFGSARQTSQQETSEMTALVSQGYTPLEQYSANFGNQGPWTDIYSLGASVYQGITGSKSVDALNRSAAALSGTADPLQKLTSLQPVGFSSDFLHAIDAALYLKPADRPQSLDQWRGVFDGTTASADETVFMGRSAATAVFESVSTESLDDQQKFQGDSSGYYPEQKDASQSAGKKLSVIPMVAGVLLLALSAGGGWWYLQSANNAPAFVIDTELLNFLPTPPSAITVRTPVERLGGEIDDLQSLALVYGQALQISSDNQVALEGLKYVSDSYSTLAQLPLVKSKNQLRQKLATAIQTLDNTDDNATKVLESLGNSVEVSLNDVESLLKNTNLNVDQREQLVFSVASLNVQDRAQLAGDQRMAKLSRQFKQSIVAALQNNEFDSAVHMIELALMLEPDDNGLQLLKSHIENTGGA